MKKTGIILALMLCLFVASAAAYTLVAGKITEADYITPVDSADVTITCHHVTSGGIIDYTLIDTSESDGAYGVQFNEGGSNPPYCDDGDIVDVSAVKDGVSGSSSGTVHENMIDTLDIAIINVAIPEFTTIAAGIALLGAFGSFFIIRKRK